MAFSKAHLYRWQIRRLAMFLRALCHPARLEILLQLALEGEKTVEEIAKNHPLSLSTLSKHLASLRVVRLLTHKDKWPYLLYKIDLKMIRKMRLYINEFFDALEKAIEQGPR
ncbi:MAG TPA: ArsR family transcriptional regulator [Saprospiraceae bacterium]|nr:ArsR family transcriptional regulator [Saprospiraceae bacterium]